MNQLLRCAAHLYPAWWRRRYGREFEALLDDVNPGTWVLLDVIKGALVMRFRTIGLIPLAGSLAGVVAGGMMAMQSPQVFASSATIQIADKDSAQGRFGGPAELGAYVDIALRASGGTPAATSVQLLRGQAPHTTVTLTYLDPDPARAQRVAEQVADTLVANYRSQALARLLSPAVVPTSPVGPNYQARVAAGGGLGFMAGGILFLVLRGRRGSGRKLRTKNLELKN